MKALNGSKITSFIPYNKIEGVQNLQDFNLDLLQILEKHWSRNLKSNFYFVK
jgi:hypothetical protein